LIKEQNERNNMKYKWKKSSDKVLNLLTAYTKICFEAKQIILFFLLFTMDFYDV